MKLTRRGLLAASAAFAYPANDTVRVGIIGPGGRARVLMRALDAVPGARIAGIADIWDTSLAEASKIAPQDAIKTKSYRELLDRKDIDAVLIGAPDHWHVQMTIDACAAGKDVYVEKPLTHSIEEGDRVIDAQNRYSRIVQVGTQQRSMPHLIKAREIVRSGQLGTIHKVHMTWNRNTPRVRASPLNVDPASVNWPAFVGSSRKQEFDAYRFRNWRWFWDFGGGIFTDLMVHWLDTVNWMLDLPVPDSAMSIGDNIHAKGIWETPDTVQTLLHYPTRGLQAYFEGTFINQRNAAMTEIMGTDATLYIDRGRYEVHPEPGRTLQPSEWIIGQGRRGADFYKDPPAEELHLKNWLDSIRTRKRPTTPAEEGVRSAAGAHLANIALRTGETARWTQAAGFQPMFNGRDLEGWQVDTPGLWSVRDGMVVGKHSGLKWNDFLRTRKHYNDFELRLKFRLVGGEGNSGIQFRSKPVPNSHEVSGYQADIGQQYWGSLYDESRRNRVLAQAPPESLEGLDKNSWNEYVILARGNHITLELNGKRTVDYHETESGMDVSGFIALQVHSGPGIEVWFRDVFIREF